MARLQFEIESDVPPDRIVAALTDFSDRRPDIWPGLKRETFKVYELGDTWAVIREGSGGPVWGPGALRLVDARDGYLDGRGERLLAPRRLRLGAGRATR